MNFGGSMKTLRLLILFLLLTSPAFGAFSLVASNPECNTYNSTTCAITFTGVTAGHSLAVAISLVDGDTITSVTCTGESNLTLIGSPQGGNSDFVSFQWAYLSNVTSSGDKTITITRDNGNYNLAGIAYEIIGCNTTACYDSGAEGGEGGSGYTGTVTLTTGSANDLLLIAAYSGSNHSNWTAPTGYTEVPFAFNSHWSTAYNLDVGAAGSKTPAWPFVGFAPYTVKGAAFKLSGGGGPTPTRRRGMGALFY